MEREQNASDWGKGSPFLRTPVHSKRLGMLATSRNRRQQASLRSATTARLSDFRSALRRCFSFDGPDEGASEWRRKERDGKDIVRPMTTDRVPVSRLIRAFCGLQKLSADSSPANRLGLRPLPMTTNHGHDRDKLFSYSFICSARPLPGKTGR